jgi:hypothetical protein
MKNNITLSRKQIYKLIEVVEHFNEVKFFTVETTENEDEEIIVKFKLFDDPIEEDSITLPQGE